MIARAMEPGSKASDGASDLRIGIEVGGTFTDWVAARGTEVISSGKVLSTPDAPDRGALHALDESELEISAIDRLVHGSTVATNAIIERQGARTGLVTTAGFADVVFIQRQAKKRLFDFRYRHPEALVERGDIVEVAERMDSQGRPLEAPNVEALIGELAHLVARRGIESVAISLLHSYANPEHEVRVEEAVRAQFPELWITRSSALSPHFREYERTSTTLISAYVRPVVERYIRRFDDRMSASSFQGHFDIVQANGGTLPSEAVREHAARMILSGPAAGVIGATAVAQEAGFDDVITLDVGGTSSDTCLITSGMPSMTSEYEVDGLPLQIPMIDIATVGAGGGSIASADAGGILHVGPESAGADPGPACYGNGGQSPTVTDAHVVLGLIRTGSTFAGGLSLRASAARSVLDKLAGELSLSCEEAAAGVRRLANMTMARAIRLVSVERGFDPSRYSLVAFGGGGPLHATEVAEELDMRTIIVPREPGLLSAYGLLTASNRHDYEVTQVTPFEAVTSNGLRAAFASLLDRARQDAGRHGLAWEDCELAYSVDVRYSGQAYDLAVPIGDLLDDPAPGPRIGARFRELHRERYGHAPVAQGLEVVNFCLAVESAGGAAAPQWPVATGTDATQTVNEVWLGDNVVDCDFHPRATLAPGAEVVGPAVVEEPTATTLVGSGWCAVVDKASNLVLRRM